MSGLLMERLQPISGLNPVADAFAGTVASDVVDMSEFSRVVFLQFVGTGATGTSTITVEACDNTTPSNTTAIAFHSRSITSGAESAFVARAAAGYTTTAGSNRIEVIEVREDALVSERRYVRAVFVEVADSPVLGGILILGERKAPDAAAESAID